MVALLLSRSSVQLVQPNPRHTCQYYSLAIMPSWLMWFIGVIAGKDCWWSPSLESCMVHSCTKKANPQGTEMLTYSNSGFYSHCMSWIKQQYPLLEIVFFSAIYMGTVLSTLGLFYSSSFSLLQMKKTRVMQNRKFGGGSLWDINTWICGQISPLDPASLHLNSI